MESERRKTPARRTSNEANLVVKVLDGFPLNAFCAILFLFSLKSEFNEHLLKFFVAIIDAELLK